VTVRGDHIERARELLAKRLEGLAVERERLQAALEALAQQVPRPEPHPPRKPVPKRRRRRARTSQGK